MEIKKSLCTWRLQCERHVHRDFWSPCTCEILVKLEFSRYIFEKYSKIKFYKNSSSGSQVVPRGPTKRQTNMTSPIDAFCNFANAPNKMGGPRIGPGTIMVDRKSPPSTGNQTPIFPPVTSWTETFVLLLWIVVLNKMCIVPAGTPTNKTQTTLRVSLCFTGAISLCYTIW
jgi:hypothetical protein